MSRLKLTDGDAQPDRNGGQDTAEHDLVIYKDMVLVNQPHQRKCAPYVNVLHIFHSTSFSPSWGTVVRIQHVAGMAWFVVQREQAQRVRLVWWIVGSAHSVTEVLFTVNAPPRNDQRCNF